MSFPSKTKTMLPEVISRFPDVCLPSVTFLKTGLLYGHRRALPKKDRIILLSCLAVHFALCCLGNRIQVLGGEFLALASLTLIGHLLLYVPFPGLSLFPAGPGANFPFPPLPPCALLSLEPNTPFRHICLADTWLISQG